MAKKKVGIYLEEGTADRLDAIASRFEGLKSDIVAAAIEMFIAAHPDEQRAALTGVMQAKVDRLFARAAQSHPPIPQRLGVVIGGREPPSTTATGSVDRESTRRPSPGQAGGKAKDR